MEQTKIDPKKQDTERWTTMAVCLRCMQSRYCSSKGDAWRNLVAVSPHQDRLDFNYSYSTGAFWWRPNCKCWSFKSGEYGTNEKCPYRLETTIGNRLYVYPNAADMKRLQDLVETHQAVVFHDHTTGFSVHLVDLATASMSDLHWMITQMSGNFSMVSGHKKRMFADSFSDDRTAILDFLQFMSAERLDTMYYMGRFKKKVRKWSNAKAGDTE
jgi:hypothetical protein